MIVQIFQVNNICRFYFVRDFLIFSTSMATTFWYVQMYLFKITDEIKLLVRSAHPWFLLCNLNRFEHQLFDFDLETFLLSVRLCPKTQITCSFSVLEYLISYVKLCENIQMSCTHICNSSMWYQKISQNGLTHVRSNIFPVLPNLKFRNLFDGQNTSESLTFNFNHFSKIEILEYIFKFRKTKF